MRGSAKQITWAEKIKADTLEQSWSASDEALLVTIDDATWWIANRGLTGAGIRRSYKMPSVEQLSQGAQLLMNARHPVMAATENGLDKLVALAQKSPDEADEDDVDEDDGDDDGEDEPPVPTAAAPAKRPSPGLDPRILSRLSQEATRVQPPSAAAVRESGPEEPPACGPNTGSLGAFRESREATVKILRTMSSIRDFAASVSKHPALAELAVMSLMAQLYASKNSEVHARLMRDAEKLRANLRDKLIEELDANLEGIDRILKAGKGTNGTQS